MKDSFQINNKIIAKEDFINFVKNEYHSNYLKSYLNKLFNFRDEWKLLAEQDCEWRMYQIGYSIITISLEYLDIIDKWIYEELEKKGIYESKYLYSTELQKILN